MPDTKISALTELSARPASNDYLVLVDVSDTTMAVSGTDKKIQCSNVVGRELLTAARTYYVRTDGNNANDGLSNASGGAFATLQKAYDTFATLDLGGVAGHKIKLGNTGTYTSALNAILPLVGGEIIIEGDTTTPANTLLSVTGSNAIAVNCPTKITVQYFKIQTTTSGSCLIAAIPGAAIVVGVNMNFGACAAYHMTAQLGGFISGGSNYAISGAASNHFFAYGGYIAFSSAVTVTITGSPAFGGKFAEAQSLGTLAAFTQTYSGSATGTRYSAVQNSVINTGGGGANYFPGNVAGSVATGGIYV